MRNLLVLGVLAAAATAPAFAQEAASGPVTVTGNVSLVTDYAWRNVSQSNQDPTIQGGFDFDFGSGFTAGVWASGIDFQDEPEDANLEVDFYGAYGFDLGGVAASVGFIYYAYPDADTADYDFYEVNAGLSKEWGAFSLGGTINWDPDNDTTYADVAAGYAITDAFSVSAGYGKYLDGFGEYGGYNVGASYSLGGLDFGLSYYDNDISGGDDNVIFSIGKSL
jgi:uncharacterized protein (TIGR02001 family)